MVIPNKYKDILDDFINSSDSESPDYVGLIDKRSYNAFRSKSSLAGLLKRDCLDKDVLNRLS